MLQLQDLYFMPNTIFVKYCKININKYCFNQGNSNAKSTSQYSSNGNLK